MRYRIEIDSPRHGVRNEYFVEFRRTDLGAESVHTDPNRPTWMGLPAARMALQRLQAPQYRIRCRILDEFGNAHTEFDDGQRARPVNIFTSHEEMVWRDEFNGMTIEIPITKNRAYDPPRYYFKFASGPDLTVVDRSIQGASPAECFERFVGNPHFANLIARYKVDDVLPAPEPPAPTGPVLQVPVVPGKELVSVSYRPGSIAR